MRKWKDRIGLTYNRCLQQPILILAGLGILTLLSVGQLQNVTIDASSDSLVAQGDPELEYYNRIAETFSQKPFLVLTYTPKQGKLLSPRHIEILGRITDEIEQLPQVSNVSSLLDAPLLRSPPIPITQLAEGYNTVQSPGVDLELAERELSESPVFKDLLISEDASTTAIQINLLAGTETGSDTTGTAAQLESADRRQQKTLEEIRKIRMRYADDASMHLGGVPMVTSDMVRMAREDMWTFGGFIMALLAACLYGFFRRLRWVIFPLMTAALSILFLLGALGALKQAITAVSGNFVALVAIVSISASVHLISRYRELFDTYKADPAACALAFETMRSKLRPSVFTGTTTMVAFASLLTSDIVPVIDFGWIMCLAIAISLFVTYSFFASVLVLLPKDEPPTRQAEAPAITKAFAFLATAHTNRVFVSASAVLAVSIVGITQIDLGSRIVEYFRGDTEIRQGLDFIDRNLGGTIPLDVVIQFEPFEAKTDPAIDDFDDFQEFDAEGDDFPERFWFTPEKLAIIDRIQGYLDGHPAFGKAISLASLERLGRTFNNDQPLSYLMLTAVLDQIPAETRATFVQPFADPATGIARISVRMHETGTEYDLDQIIQGIEEHAVSIVGLDPENIHITGVAVLFRDMLGQLVSSQVATLSVVLLLTFAMFATLLRSWQLALVGLLPNVVCASAILAVMGLAGIPLDLMTITIAAIVIGIGVDDAIHYLHRYKEERIGGLSPQDAVNTTQRNIGAAIYFTSLTVVVGFSALLFSRFVPNAYFGLLAALAMVFALIANLTLLPALLIKTDRQEYL